MGNYSWTYSIAVDGGGTVTFTTNDTPTSGSQYLVTGVSGAINGSSITGLGAPGTPVYTATVNNLLDTSVSPAYGYISSGGGVTFSTADGSTYSFAHEPSSIDPMMHFHVPETFWVRQTAPSFSVRPDTPTAYTTSAPISACFTPNTLISTPTGGVPVKDLHIGDLILNHLGQSVPVKWIGRQCIHPAFAGDSLPICIRQGAL